MIYQGEEERRFIEHNSVVFVIFFIIIGVLFFIGLILSIRKYRKKKSVNSLVLVFLMLQGLVITVGNVIVFYTSWVGFFSLFSGFSILFFITTLILLNVRLEKKVKQKSKEIEISEEKYRNLVLNIVDIIIELDPDLKISFVSPQINSLLLYKSHEIINHNISEFIYSDDLSIVKASIQDSIKNKEYSFVECRMIKKSGDLIDVAIRGSLLENNKETKVVGVIRDITDQKRAENILKEKFDKLKEIEQVRSNLVRKTSHELKTPLISLFSSTQHLLDTYKDEMSEEVLKFVKIVNRGGKRLKDLIDNLLDAYNIESKGLILKKEQFNLVKSIKDCANDLIFSLEERDLYLKEELEESFFIDADKGRIEQVILNLLSNAIKNTPPKGIIAISLNHNEEFVDIIIKDTGIGLTEEEKKQLFAKFGKIERTDVDFKINNEGSGLGLFISKEIVELHGGNILVDSEGRNNGSSFTIRLPLK